MRLVSDVIKPLVHMTPQARTMMKTTTIASILWSVFKQTPQYTMRLMCDKTALVPEWTIVISNLRGAQDFTLLQVPMEIVGIVVTPQLEKSSKKRSKENDDKQSTKDKTK